MKLRFGNNKARLRLFRKRTEVVSDVSNCYNSIVVIEDIMKVF